VAEAVPLLSITLESLTALNADFVAEMQGVTEEVQAIDAAGGGASQRLTVAIRFAQPRETLLVVSPWITGSSSARSLRTRK
jgi:hypothetical protein